MRWLGGILLATALAACSASVETKPLASEPPPVAAAPSPELVPPPEAALPPPANRLSLDCAGAFAQGGVVVCRTAPGAQLIVDGEERGAADALGWVVAGFDRDAPAKAMFTVRVGAEIKRAEYAIAPRAFSIQRIDGLPQETVTPTDPLVLQRIARDRETKNRGFASRAPAEGFLDGFIWPTTGRLSGPWGNQRVLNGVPKTPHYGFDVAAPAGTPIRAPASGVIALAEPDLHFEGGLVLLDHGQGLISMYLHMSRIDVQVGDKVVQGQVLGAVGAKGRATGAHLCWRMKWRDRNLDPSLAVQALAAVRGDFALGAPAAPGVAPAGFTPWTPAP